MQLSMCFKLRMGKRGDTLITCSCVHVVMDTNWGEFALPKSGGSQAVA